MKIDFSRLDALRPTAAVPEGFEPVPEAETPFDSGYEAMYRAAWDFHLETDDRLRAALDYLLAETEYMLDYFTGKITKEEALANFYTYVNDKYPAIVTP